MDRVPFEFGWRTYPAFPDEFVLCQSLEGLQFPTVIVCTDEVLKVPLQLFMMFVLIPLDPSFLDRAIHVFDLAIGSGMLNFC